MTWWCWGVGQAQSQALVPLALVNLMTALVASDAVLSQLARQAEIKSCQVCC